MKTVRGFLTILVVCAISSGAALAQSMISAKSGLIQYTEGQVLLDRQAVEPKFGSFPQMKENSVLRTEAGRAEVLLSPGVWLRMGENGGLRLVSDRITDTRLELLAGSVLIECAEILKGNTVTIAYKDSAVSLRDDGLYRIDSLSAELRVYDGQAVVESGGDVATVKRGKAVSLDGALLVRKFDSKATDSLYRWSRRRGEYIAMANIPAARRLWTAKSAWSRSGWYWNPDFGMFTFIPGRGSWFSPFGYGFYSPRAVYVVFQPPARRAATRWDPTPRYDGNRGYSTISATPAGTSGTVASTPQPAAPSGATVAPIDRGTGSAGGRQR